MKIKKFVLISVLLFVSTYTLAQLTPPAIKWQHAYGGKKDEQFRSTVLTDDGGFISCGYAKSKHGDVSTNQGAADYWVVKCDSSGSIEWEKSYGGSDNDWARNIMETKDHCYVVSGYSLSNDGDVEDAHGDYDAWLLKIDSEGNIIGKRNFGGSGFDNAYNTIETSDGNFVMTGFSNSADGDITDAHGGQDLWLLKFDRFGNKIWSKTYGGTKNEQGSIVLEAADHTLMVLGFTGSSDMDVSNHFGGKDFWLLKLTLDGDLLWEKTYGGTENDAGRWMDTLPDGGFILAGFASSSDYDVSENKGDFDYWVVRVDGAGNLLWQKSYGGSKEDYPYYIKRTMDGNFLVTGDSWSENGDVTDAIGGGDSWLIEIDSVGSLLWQESFGGSQYDEGRAVLELPDHDLLLSGYVDSEDGEVTGEHGGEDGWIVRMECSDTSQRNQAGDHSGDCLIRIQPNPNDGNFIIAAESIPVTANLCTLQVTDVLGNEVWRQHVSGTALTSYLVHLPGNIQNGIYFLRLTGIHEQPVKKIIVNR